MKSGPTWTQLRTYIEMERKKAALKQELQVIEVVQQQLKDDILLRLAPGNYVYQVDSSAVLIQITPCDLPSIWPPLKDKIDISILVLQTSVPALA